MTDESGNALTLAESNEGIYQAGSYYSYGAWSAQDSAEAQDAAVEALLSKGLDANMIRFETGTVFKEGQIGMEHMASFNYAYKLTAVQDWLFAQSK